MKLKVFACFGLIILAASLASGQQKPSSATTVRSGAGNNVDWAQFNFDPAHDGYNPLETILSPANVGNVTLKWSYEPVEGDLQGQPAVANGVAYFLVGNEDSQHSALYAMDADTGKLIWKQALFFFFGSPAVGNGMVYVSTGEVYAYDANTGAMIWESQGDSYDLSPTVANNMVYVVSSNFVDALDANTGKLIWHHQLTGFPRFLDTSSAVANGLVYLPTQDGFVYALNASTGSLVWSRNFGISPTPRLSQYRNIGDLCVSNGVVYAAVANAAFRLDDYNVYALNANTGATIWKSPLTGEISYGSVPAVANGMVYVELTSGSVYALNANTGALVWQHQVDASFGAQSTSVANGVVYAGSFQVGEQNGWYTMSALDASTGNLLWSNTAFLGAYRLISSPAIVNGVIYGIPLDDSIGAFSLPNE
jgi:outer membrane protein assembly factor BamB